MDTPRLILIAAAVVQLAVWLMLAGRYRTPTAAPGQFILRYGWKLRLLGLCIAFAIPMLLIVVLSVTAAVRTAPVVQVGVTLLALGFTGGALLMETQGVYLILAENSIAGVSPWRRRREWRWQEVERVTFSHINRWLTLHGPRGETMRAALFLVGMDHLARAILRHVSGPKLVPARRILDKLAADKV